MSTFSLEPSGSKLKVLVADLRRGRFCLLYVGDTLGSTSKFKAKPVGFLT